MLKKLLLGPVEHEIKVTRIKGRGYGVRVLVDGEVNQQAIAEDRTQIGRVAKELLRMEDKCGNESDFANASRNRKKAMKP